MPAREKLNDDKVYGAPWAEFFISTIIAKIVQAVWLPDWGLIILLPITWVLVHALVGSWLEKNAHKDLLGKEDK